MKRNMKNWMRDFLQSTAKKPLPILSFPAVELLGISVRELLTDSENQAKGMQAVADCCDTAAAVSYMDLSVEAECFGAPLSSSDEEVPTVVGRTVSSREDAERLRVPEVGSGRTQICIEAIQKASERITDRPVLAGMIGPFSLAARLFDLTEIMIACFEDPDTVHTVLEKAAEFLINYAKALRAAGANGVMMAEPVAGLLDPYTCADFSSPYVKRIADALQTDEFAVIYHNCGGSALASLDSILATGCAAYHFGNALDMGEILAAAPRDTVVMGNLDPVGVLRDGTPDCVRKQTLALLTACAEHPNFVLSSGCDMPPKTPWANIDAFFSAAKEFYGN